MNYINATLKIICHQAREIKPWNAIWVLKDLELFSNFTSNVTIKTWELADAIDDKFKSEVEPALTQGQSDLAVGYYFLTSSRLQRVTALHPICDEKFWAFFRKIHFSSVINIYDEPFSQELFIIIFLFILLFILTTFISMKALNLYDLQNILYEAIWLVVSFSCLKSYPFKWKHPTLQIIFLCGILLFSLLFAIYSGFMTSVLTRNPSPINSIDDLDQFKFTYFALPQIYSTVLKVIEQRNTNNTDEQSLESLERTFYGHHAHIDQLLGFIELSKRLKESVREELCTIISQLPMPKSSNIVSGFYVPRNSTFRNVLNIGLLRIRNVGLTGRYTRNYYRFTRLDNCTEVNHRYQADLGIRHVFSAFCLLLVFAIIALLIFCVEICFY